MKPVSILNEVLGPVMRGPSSSHTAGSFHIARIIRDLAGSRPSRARFTFDPRGSYAQVFREQGVDRGFAVGLLGWALTDPRFFRVLDLAPAEGLDLQFDVRPLGHADHPNTVEIELDPQMTQIEGSADSADSRGLVDPQTTQIGAAGPLRATARSIGGGSVEILSIDGWPVRLTGEAYEVLIEVDQPSRASALEQLSRDGELVDEVRACEREGRLLLHARRYAALSTDARRALERLARDGRVREARPIAFVKRGPGLFGSAAEMIALADARKISLGRLALAHEASLLAMSEADVIAEMLRRLDVMSAAVADGLGEADTPMQLLEPSARRVFEAEAAGRVAIGGLHTRAAARALAAMHVNSRMGVVCAAPTGGSAGVLPGVIVTLMEEAGLKSCSTSDPSPAALALFAAGAIGVVVAERATFAAEVAGCQVEIGAAGAMAAAAVVEAAGGTAKQAADAAAIAFQNTMGSVCDLVQGIVEIPCHTRNAAAASNAFVCADLVLGGYGNPIPLDETVDAVFAVGRMLPAELRCTARGGLAVTPSAVAMKRRVVPPV
jgi:L-serine dehydratase